MRTHTQRTAALCLIGMLAVPTADAAPKIVGLTPATEHNCLSFRIELSQGQALAGLRWQHNDSTLPFPRLLLMEAQGNASPDLSQTGLILEDITGEELGWGEVDFATAVTSTTGSIHAVFVFPASLPTTGLGDGGGPGLGVELNGTGPTFEVSPDGIQWIRYQPEYRLVVEPILAGAAKMATQSLADLAERVDYELPETAPSKDEEAPAILRNALHAATPNPFNPRTQIRYDLREAQRVKLSLYDVRGRLVVMLVDGIQSAGRHDLIWDGVDGDGSPVASGVYFLRLELAQEHFEERLTLVR